MYFCVMNNKNIFFKKLVLPTWVWAETFPRLLLLKCSMIEYLSY